MRKLYLAKLREPTPAFIRAVLRFITLRIVTFDFQIGCLLLGPMGSGERRASMVVEEAERPAASVRQRREMTKAFKNDTQSKRDRKFGRNTSGL